MYWLGDTIARINNALILKKRNVKVKATRHIIDVLNVLKQANFIADYKVEDDLFKTCEITLKYYQNSSVIKGFKLVSKPSRRVYIPYKDLEKNIKNFAFPIISTSRGVISGKEAYLSKIGGEFLCEVK